MLWGVDLGGTKTEIVVLPSFAEAEPIIRRRVPTPQGEGYEAILAAIHELVSDASRDLGVSPSIVGFGTPGVIDPVTQQLKNSNTQCLNGKPFVRDVSSRLGCEVRVANDANCLALAEARLGAGRGHDVVFGVILGTGVGGGLVVGGRVLEGRQGICGEWGHNRLEWQGKECYCGKRGCVERVLSGPALEQFYRDAAGEVRSLPEIMRRARLGSDQRAEETLGRLIDYFGQAISVVINIVDPDVIVLAGGVSNIDELYTLGAEAARKNTFNPRPDLKIVRNQLGDSAGVFGAACLSGS